MKKIGAEVQSMSCVIFLNLIALLSFRDWSGKSLEVWKTEYISGSTHVFPLWTGAWCWRGGSWIGQCVMYGTVIVPVQQTRDIHSMLFQCWTIVEDGGPTMKQHLGEFLVFAGVPPYHVIHVRVKAICKTVCIFQTHAMIQCCINVGPASTTLVQQ